METVPRNGRFGVGWGVCEQWSLSPTNCDSLRALLRDMAALAALSTLWVGGPRLEAAERLADLLVGALGLDFAYLRLQSGELDGRVIDVAAHHPRAQ